MDLHGPRISRACDGLPMRRSRRRASERRLTDVGSLRGDVERACSAPEEVMKMLGHDSVLLLHGRNSSPGLGGGVTIRDPLDLPGSRLARAVRASRATGAANLCGTRACGGRRDDRLPSGRHRPDDVSAHGGQSDTSAERATSPRAGCLGMAAGRRVGGRHAEERDEWRVLNTGVILTVTAKQVSCQLRCETAIC